MKNFIKTLVVVIAVIFVVKTGIGWTQDYICTNIENDFETLMNETFAEETDDYFEAHVNAEFTSPLTIQIKTVVYDWYGQVCYKDCSNVDLINYL